MIELPDAVADRRDDLGMGMAEHRADLAEVKSSTRRPVASYRNAPSARTGTKSTNSPPNLSR